MLTADHVMQLAETFRLMGDPSRLKIMLACLDYELSVGDIAHRTGLSVSLASHHLRLLRGSRIVQPRRQGKQMFYGVQDTRVACVLRDMVAHAGEAAAEADAA